MSHSGQTGAEAETGGKVRGITPVKAALGVLIFFSTHGTLIKGTQLERGMAYVMRVADDDDSAFGWRMYGAFIVENIYPLKQSSIPKNEWLDIEAARFHKSWKFLNSFIIEDSSKPIGWASFQRCNQRVTMHNLYVSPTHDFGEVASWVIGEMSAEWSQRKVVVDVIVLSTSSKLDVSVVALSRLGFSESGDDGMAKTFSRKF